MQNEPFWKAKGVLLKNRGKTKEKKVTKSFFLKLFLYFCDRKQSHETRTITPRQ